VEDIKKFVQTAVNNKLPFTIRGTGTWPFGGCVPLNGDIILDLSQLRRMTLNKQDSTLYIEPGVTFAEARNYLRDEGFTLIQEITNPYSGTVAGWISTGGQGLGSYKYGHVTESIAEIQIVTPSGEFKTCTKNDKDFSLYTGTEGQLGIITGITLKVQENRYISKPYAFTFQSCKESVEFIKKISDNDLTPTSVIYYDEPYIKLVCEIERENLVKLQQDCLERKDEKRLSELSSDLDEIKTFKKFFPCNSNGV
jgi:FAD/FMN-containing dehydrogenase